MERKMKEMNPRKKKMLQELLELFVSIISSIIGAIITVNFIY